MVEKAGQRIQTLMQNLIPLVKLGSILKIAGGGALQAIQRRVFPRGRCLSRLVRPVYFLKEDNGRN